MGLIRLLNKIPGGTRVDAHKIYKIFKTKLPPTDFALHCHCHSNASNLPDKSGRGSVRIEDSWEIAVRARARDEDEDEERRVCLSCDLSCDPSVAASFYVLWI
ncbi:hypothetical protein M5D96_004041 [Drosophila gunungcola]|uniref:Uncharacterized protein n=1 Tax=Drosophila gunungcola TaxID=103775 RepID=A0A9Q0BT05_9MUSC|nr:hypothetical protein M5D96_004041 [Drosophila gunungcola]